MVNPVAPYAYLLPIVYLFLISQIQTCLCLVVDLDFMRSIAKIGKSGRHCWVWEVSTQFAQRVVTSVTAPPLVGCVIWSLDLLYITLLLHLFLSWTSSLSILSSAMSTFTLSPYPSWSSNWSSAFNSIINPYIFSPSLRHMSMPSQPTTYYDSCDRLNYTSLLNSALVCPHIHLIIYTTLTPHQLARA